MAAKNPPDDPVLHPEEQDFHDRKDAGRVELIVYGLGGIIDDIGAVGFRMLSSLLVIGFGFSPLIAGFFGALKTLWDGIMDPIVAHLSDNFESRWGRRRPFILVGAVLMGIFSWVTWTFLPSNNRVKPNEPVVPVVFHSESDWKEFGELLLAYATPQSSVRVSVASDAPEVFNTSTIGLAVEKALADLAKASRDLVAIAGQPEAEGTAANGTPPENGHLHMRVKVISATPIPDAAEADPAGFVLILRTALTGPGASATTAREFESVIQITNQPLPALKETKLVMERILDFFAGKPKQAGLVWRSSESTVTTNIRAKRAHQRALVAGLHYALTETLGHHFAIPYWRALPDGAVVPEATKDRVADLAFDRATNNPAWEHEIVTASGAYIPISKGAGQPPTPPAPPTWLSSSNVDERKAGFIDLWEGLELLRARNIVVASLPTRAPEKKLGMWANIAHGFKALTSSDADDRKLLLFVLVMYILMSFGNTLYSATYYALGIEIAPSYEGRTRAIAYRAFINGIMGIIGTAFLPFILLPIFADFREGARTLSTVSLAVGVPLSLWCFFGTHERTVIVRDQNKKKPSFFRSIKEISSSLQFWRITGLYLILGNAMGIFNVFGTYVAVYYVFGGNLLLASSYGAITGIIGTLTAMGSIPFVIWLCKHFEKQTAMQIILAILLCGSVMKYFCYNPNHPELMFLVAPIYGLAASGVFNVLGTMMADITDLDELQCGERREGMFGAVVAVINKATNSLCVLISGVLVIAVGFQIEKGAYQASGVYHTMLILFSIVPAATGLLGFILLLKYPLTRRRCDEIKEQLAANRKAMAMENAAASPPSPVESP